jgi:hypothetical protein
MQGLLSGRLGKDRLAAHGRAEEVVPDFVAPASNRYVLIFSIKHRHIFQDPLKM